MHFSYPMNAMLLFMNMEKMMGPDFESGLADMKKYAETHNTPTVAIQEVQFAEHNYAGMRKIVNWKDLSQYFMDSYGALGKEAGARINGPAVGIYYTWDTVNHSTDMVAAFPVADTSKPVKGAKFVHVGACKAYMVAYTGVYSGMTNVHMALNKKLAEKGQKMAGVIEEYMRGPHEDQDSTKWVTNIYYLVQ
jgi:effector-binding domain-containing protein